MGPAAQCDPTRLFAIPGSRNNQIVMERIAAVRLPAIFQFPETAEAGAFAGYGPRFYRALPVVGASGGENLARRQACRHSGRATLCASVA